MDFDGKFNFSVVAYTHQFGMSDLMIKKIRAGRRSSTVMASEVSGAKKNESVKASKRKHIWNQVT